MICARCGLGLPLIEFNWIRLKSYKFVVNDKNRQGQWAYGKWETYCKECAYTITEKRK